MFHTFLLLNSKLYKITSIYASVLKTRTVPSYLNTNVIGM